MRGIEGDVGLLMLDFSVAACILLHIRTAIAVQYE
jgi:hypothetical protein